MTEGSSPTSLGELEISFPDATTKRVPLVVGNGIRVGRVNSNDIVLPDVNVSRFHSLFNCTADEVLVSDLGSRNGTFLNGERVVFPAKLKAGDVVAISETTFRVHLISAAPTIDDSETHRTQTIGLRAAQVTILVADVSSYTKMSETLPSEDVCKMLDSWLAQATGIVRKHGGFVDKYIGDAIMAVWQEGIGGDEAKKKPKELAVNAMTAARKILEATEQLGETEWKHTDRFPWRCKISLCSGDVLYGSMGSSDAREQTYVGDNVNLAFRINSLAGELKKSLIIAKRTAELLAPEFQLTSLGTHSVKGKSDKVEVFTV